VAGVIAPYVRLNPSSELRPCLGGGGGWGFPPARFLVLPFLFLSSVFVGGGEVELSPRPLSSVVSGWWTSDVRVVVSVAVKVYRGSFPQFVVWRICGSLSIWHVAESLSSR